MDLANLNNMHVDLKMAPNDTTYLAVFSSDREFAYITLWPSHLHPYTYACGFTILQHEYSCQKW